MGGRIHPGGPPGALGQFAAAGAERVTRREVSGPAVLVPVAVGRPASGGTTARRGVMPAARLAVGEPAVRAPERTGDPGPAGLLGLRRRLGGGGELLRTRELLPAGERGVARERCVTREVRRAGERR